MSGGAYTYKYSHVLVMAEEVEIGATQQMGWDPITKDDKLESRPAEETKDRLEMASFLRKTAEAMRALEWYDSGDTGDWEEVKRAFRAARASE